MNVMLQKSHLDIKELRYKLLEYETNAENNFDKTINGMKLELKNNKDELYSCKMENTELMNEITHLKYCMHKLQRNLLDKTHMNGSWKGTSGGSNSSVSDHVMNDMNSSSSDNNSMKNNNNNNNNMKLNTKNVEIIETLRQKYEKYYHLAKKWKTEKEKLEFELKKEETKQNKLIHIVRLYEEMFAQLNIQLPMTA